MGQRSIVTRSGPGNPLWISVFDFVHKQYHNHDYQSTENGTGKSSPSLWVYIELRFPCVQWDRILWLFHWVEIAMKLQCVSDIYTIVRSCQTIYWFVIGHAVNVSSHVRVSHEWKNLRLVFFVIKRQQEVKSLSKSNNKKFYYNSKELLVTSNWFLFLAVTLFMNTPNRYLLWQINIYKACRMSAWSIFAMQQLLLKAILTSSPINI